MKTYFDGEFVDDAKATVSVRSRALNYGLGCLGGVRGYLADDGSQVFLFRLHEHARRLEMSAKILGLRVPCSNSEVENIVAELVRQNELHSDVYIRPLLINDSPHLAPMLSAEDSRLIVYLWPVGQFIDTDAISVKVSSWRRVRDNAIPSRAKPTAAYLNSALASKEAADDGFDEAIFLTESGTVSEGTAEHVFIVRDGVLFAPPSTEDNLEGITRRSLIELAVEDLGLKFVERPVSRTELYVADEVFLCGTGVQVVPVKSVDRRIIGGGGPGVITTKIRDHFNDVVRGRVASRRSWLTSVWE